MFLQANNQIETNNLHLAKKNGTWNSKGAGDIRFYSKTLKNLNFDKKDSICIVINHAMRSTNTNQIKEIRGISSVGLEIIKED